MSCWKKASKVNQWVPLERHQPEKRANLGILEKHKDYIHRAKDFQRKRNVLKKLQEKALDRNPDEYYHHMVNSQLVDDAHQEKKKPLSEDTLEQKDIMGNRSIAYVRMKYQMEKKKCERLKSELHFIDNPAKVTLSCPEFLMHNTAGISSDVKQKNYMQKTRQYKKLLKSLERTKKLNVIKEKMEIQEHLNKSKKDSRPKLIKNSTKESAPVYEWKYERKR